MECKPKLIFEEIYKDEDYGKKIISFGNTDI